MLIKTKKTLTPVDQWTRLCKALEVHKIVTFVVCLLSLATMYLYVTEITKPPIVILERAGEQSYFKAEFKDVEITDAVATDLIQTFLTRYYTKSANENEASIENLKPLISPGLQEKLEKALVKSQKIPEEIEGKDVSQLIAGIDLSFSDKDVTAEFFKIVTIDKTSLLQRSKVKLTLQKWDATSLNPVGIYINSFEEVKL